MFSKTNLDINIIIEMFNSGISLREIARKFNTTHKTIIKHLDGADFKRTKKNFYPKREDIDTNKIIKLYKHGKTTIEISEMLGCSKHLIFKRINLAGFDLKEYRDVLYHNFFSEYTAENCYWAGFLAADGWVNANRLGLEIKDKEHINIFYKKINIQTKIYCRKRNGSITYSIGITSKQIVEDLKNNFNVIENKSLVFLPPQNIEKEFLSCFIRGYIDGDGSIRKKDFGISILGTKNMLLWIKEIFNKNCNINSKAKVRKEGNIYSIGFGGRIQCGKIIDWLYKTSTPETRLNRKYEIAMEYLKKAETNIKLEIQNNGNGFSRSY